MSDLIANATDEEMDRADGLARRITEEFVGEDTTSIAMALAQVIDFLDRSETVPFSELNDSLRSIKNFKDSAGGDWGTVGYVSGDTPKA